MNDLNLFAPILKVDPLKQEVTGIIAEEAPDKSREIFDYETGKAAVSEWSDGFKKATDGKSLGNVRSMHGNHAAGKLAGIEFDDTQKRITVTAKIVDRAEFEKCAEGVYTGFSIGGSYTRKWDDPTLKGHTRYTPRLAEVSLVDNPCMYGATFTAVKSDGSEEIRKFIGTHAEANVTLPLVAKAISPMAVRDSLSKASNDKMSTCARLVVAAKKQGIEVNPDKYFADAMEKVKGLPPYSCGAGHIHFTKRAAETCITNQTESLTKGMYHIGPMADALCQIEQLRASLAYEAEYENDDSEIPDRLKSVAKDLAGILVDLTEEESKELIAAAKGVFLMADDLSKAGSSSKMQAAHHSAMAKHHESIGSVHEKMADHHAKMADHFAAAHEKETGKALTTEDLGKAVETDKKADPVTTTADPTPVAKLDASNDALAKALDDIKVQFDQQAEVNKMLAETLKKISDQPAGLPGRVISITKAEDSSDVKKDDEPKTASEAMKKVHAGR